MTTIRRITTSQIDGNSANTDNTNEIRPFGEASFFVDTSGPTDKLVLSMFEGTKTHLKSKVVGPGVLYGSNADSGDGGGLDTIKLIPDAALHFNDGNLGNDQYIVVDPTGGEPGHIHLRAGGTQDNSSADLYLGGELTCVRVSDTSGIVTVRTTNVGDPNITLDWSFQTDGNLYFPGIGNNRIGESEPGLVVSSDASVVLQSNNTIVSNYEVEFIGFIHNGFGDAPGATLTVTEIIAGTITDGMTIYGNGLPPEGWTLTFGGVLEPQGSGGTGNYLLSGANFFTSPQSFNNGVLAAGSQAWIFGSNGNLTLPNNSVIRADGSNVEVGNLTNFNVEAAGVVNIYTNTEGVTPYQWQFGDAGELIFPDATVQTTAYTGGTGPTTILDLGITDGTNGQVLTANGDGTFSFTTVGGVSNTLDGLTDVVITTPTTGQVLKFDGVNWVNDTDSTGSLVESDPVFTASAAAGITGTQVTNWDAAYGWGDHASAGYLVPTINTTAATATALADTDTVNLELTGGRAYVLYKVQTSHAAWVRVYTNAAARTADSGRAQGVDPGINAGVVAEAITAGAETVVFAPAVNGFNDESPTTDVMPIAVTNLSGTTNDITVTVTKLTLVA